MLLPRTIAREVDTGSWRSLNRRVPRRISQQFRGTAAVDLAEVLLHTALRTAPPFGYGFELCYFWPFLRYLVAFDAVPDLRLRSEWSETDAHQKMILSDEIGVGVASVLITNALNLAAMAPTGYVVSMLGLAGDRTVTLSKTGKRGPKKSPDYLGLELNGPAVHVIECKGTQVSKDALKGLMASGVAQKQNVAVAPAALLGEALVIGTYVAGRYASDPSTCCVRDPPAGGGLDGRAVGFGELLRLALRAEIAAALHLAGFAPVANAVATEPRLPRELAVQLRRRAADLEPVELRGVRARVRTVEQLFPVTGWSVETGGEFAAPNADRARVRGARMRIGISDELVHEVPHDLGEALERAGERAERGWLRVEDDAQLTLLTPSGVALGLELLTE